MGGTSVDPIEWKSFPLPLIQVNPPDLALTNEILETAYQNGIFSNSGEIQRTACKILAKHVHEKFEGYLASSNTAALAACLIASNVRGKHVVISNFTFAATLDAVILAGGIPVVCDVDENSLVMSSHSLEGLLAKKNLCIAAVVPTRVLGYVTDISELVGICEMYQVPIIIDSAASFPARENCWKDYPQIHFEVFSFHATKVFGIGEGGFVVGHPHRIDALRKSSNFGLLGDDSLKFGDGLNAKADEFTSARALARFPSYAEDVFARQEFVKIYENIFLRFKHIRCLISNDSNVYSYFPIIFENENSLLDFREEVSHFITTRRYYFPSISEGYVGTAEIIFDDNLEVSNSICKRILCLPVYVKATEETRREIDLLLNRVLEGVN